jgi:fructokinase
MSDPHGIRVAGRAPRVVCFGEVLWDCLPGGRLPGGAPLNVTYHLHRLGAEAHMISAVGHDAAGDDLLAYLASRGLSTALIQRHAARATGMVEVALSAAGQPRYTILEGVAWDEIALDDATRRAVEECDAFIYGSLAARSATSRATLEALLAIAGPLRVMDVNLRPPFDDPARVLALARRADLVKLNDDEIERLTGMPIAGGLLPRALERLREITGCERLCVTRGAAGAMFSQPIAVLHAPAPRVKVCDTIGAGDAFTAALVHGVLTRPVAQSPETLRRACALGARVASLPGGQPEW